MISLRLLLVCLLAPCLSGIVAGGDVLPGAMAQETFSQSELWIETSSGRHRFTVEIADTPGRRAQGLMFREDMPVDHGMLFEFERLQPVAMWMRNTLIPLDMLFINPDGTIHHIIAAAEPRTDTTRSSEGKVLGVLELNAHVTQLLGIRTGDRVIHPFFGTK
ncbi:MAG: DUF192 domain-containing protein [Geminicoccaceae bacterium]|nr:DUF192 domain-containing protein [Geminicoccaceae bacterium]MCB9945521.1 DUF192 domain-containing protein [Geminicoccaceae bacterium]